MFMKKFAGFIVVTGVVALAAGVVAGESKSPSKATHFKPIGFLEGTWEGTSDNDNRTGKVERTYELVLGGRFLYGRNKTTYEPSTKNPKAETHEEWSIYSLDKNRKTIVLRQFHGEGFVNQFTLTSKPDDDKTPVFTTEAIENIGAGWRARETYKVLGPDEFEESFELAGPGKEFEPYSKASLKRKK